jgi:hypothetical protein
METVMTMPKPASSSPALPIAHVVLRILIVLKLGDGARDPGAAVRHTQQGMDHVGAQARSFA